MRKKIRGVLNPLYKKYKKHKTLKQPEFVNGKLRPTSPSAKCHMSFKLTVSPKYRTADYSLLED